MNDEPVSKPIGRYQGAKVYAARWHSLANPMLPERLRRQFQVLIMSHGELCWINTDPKRYAPC